MIIEHLIQKPSPNYSGSRIIVPKVIVIHWLGGGIKGSLAWLQSKKSKVSYHFVIDMQDNIYQLVDTAKRAWHAGISQFMGKNDVNSFSIGISLEGPPSKLGLEGWPKSQILITAELCKELVKIHPTIAHITDHSTISPGRKFDVKLGKGEDVFPWADLVTMTGLKDYKK